MGLVDLILTMNWVCAWCNIHLVGGVKLGLPSFLNFSTREKAHLNLRPELFAFSLYNS